MGQSTVTVTVAPLDAVRLTAPVDGAQYAPGTVIPLQAVAPPGSTVEFLCNGAVVGARSSPYTMLVTLSAGVKAFSVRLKAVAPPPPPPPPPAPILASPNDTYGPSVIDATGGVWTLGAHAGVANGPTLRNGAPMGGGYAAAYLWLGGVVYVYADGYGWYRWAGGWIAFNPDTEASDVRPFRGRRGGGGVYVPPAFSTTWTVTSMGYVTRGLVAPQGAIPVGSGVQVAAFTTQTDVKTTWPDGSLRFAVISFNATSTGAKTVTVISNPGGSFTPTWPSASVAFDIAGTVYTATMPAFGSATTYYSGGVMREARASVTPMNGATPHPLLTVIFDVRSYNGSGHRVDVQVANCKDITAGDHVSYDCTVTLAGSSVYTITGRVHNWSTRWRKFFLTSLTEGEITHDFEPFYAAKAVPRFHASIATTVPSYDAATFEPLEFGNIGGMGAPGPAEALGPYPDSTAIYLTHQTAAARTYMMACADAAGSWRGHIATTDGVTIIDLDAMPVYVTYGAYGPNPTGPNPTVTYWSGSPIYGASTIAPVDPLEAAHLYSLSFVPWLVTGDRWHLDEMKYWSNWSLMQMDGNGTLPTLQKRDFGWTLRYLADLAAYCPDDEDPTYWTSRVTINLDIVVDDWLTMDDGPLNLPVIPGIYNFPPVGTGEGTGPGDSRGDFDSGNWRHAYVCYALDRCRQHGLGSQADAFISKQAAQQILVLTSAAAGWPQADGGMAYIIAGFRTSGVTTWYTTLAEIYTISSTRYPSSAVPLYGYYGAEARMLCLQGKARGLTNAQTALDYLNNVAGIETEMVTSRVRFALLEAPI